jgi:cell division protein FtsB
MASREATRNQTEQRAQRSRRVLTGVFFFVACVLVVDALVGDQGLIATIRARKQYDELASELVRLRSENAGLREEARRLREDPAAIEEIARRELGLMSPGETLFIVRDIDSPSNK